MDVANASAATLKAACKAALKAHPNTRLTILARDLLVLAQRLEAAEAARVQEPPEDRSHVVGSSQAHS